MLTFRTRKGLTLAVGLGFGMGLMAGAAVLAMTLKPPPTDDAIVARARQLGMVKATEIPVAPAKVQVQKVASIVVAEGGSFSDVAGMLKEAGVIADAEALMVRARERDLLGRLRAGVHVILFGEPGKALTLDQVIDLVITK